MVHVVLVSAAD